MSLSKQQMTLRLWLHSGVQC